jgi:periplasmic divalent cation tolerance protein
MEPPMEITRLLVHCPDRETARALAAALLDARLVACANIYGEIESHYVWQGTREAETEIPLALKTRAELVPAVAAMVQILHPYDVPPIVAQRLDYVIPAYADWVVEMTEDART